MLIIGIDPGANGALALCNRGVIECISDMPTIEEKVGKTNRKRVSPALLTDLLRGWMSLDVAPMQLYLEKVGGMPKDGGAAAFAFGAGYGIVLGVAAAMLLPLTLVTPQEWKRVMACPTDKNGARARACQLIPSQSSMFARVKDDGRAEAALISLYGYRQQ